MPELEYYDEYVLAGGRLAQVVRMCSRYFVITGGRTQPRSSWDVSNPYDTYAEANRKARGLQTQSYTDEVCR